jgi:hypothetical protein
VTRTPGSGFILNILLSITHITQLYTAQLL